MSSVLLPSDRVVQLVHQYQALVNIEENLPTDSDISQIVPDMTAHITVQIEGDGDVVQVGFDGGEDKVISHLERQVSSAGSIVSTMMEEISSELSFLFEDYTKACVQEVDDGPEIHEIDDWDEALYFYGRRNLTSMSVSDWAEAIKIIPSSNALESVVKNWTPQASQKMSWWPGVEKMMQSPSACAEVFKKFLVGSTEFSSNDWVDHFLPNLTRGYQSAGILKSVSGVCALRHAMNLPGSSFASKTYSQWYDELSALGITPSYDNRVVSQLLVVSEGSVAAKDVQANQKLIMARLRRLIFLDPNHSKADFSVFASGSASATSGGLSIVGKEITDTNVAKVVMDAARYSLSSQNNRSHSVGKCLSDILVSVDSVLSTLGKSPQIPYADKFYEIRKELEIGSSLSSREDQELSQPRLPKI